jgi:hypothetical protein
LGTKPDLITDQHPKDIQNSSQAQEYICRLDISSVAVVVLVPPRLKLLARCEEQDGGDAQDGTSNTWQSKYAGVSIKLARV